MIELALPAGNLETALTALKSGADAVYFGMKEFSARKGAENFSEEDLSKIRRYALDNGRKIYITINTLIDDAHLEEANRLLSTIAFYGCDGLIVQDLGLAYIIRKNYPSLPLHASTQLAVHTAAGVRELQRLGFERAVLSRELTLSEIAAIRKECPDIELKAFIHGALCYGFSGLCMASYEKCGRSANGGECAQICRSWFTDEKTGENGYFFSMEDLAAGSILKQLDEMGIDSAKIEGRLKGPEYVASLARYYRGILEGKDDGKEIDSIRTTFARKQGDGYFNYRPDRPSLLTGSWPGHLGLEAGTIVSSSRHTIEAECDKEINNHDGLQYLVTGASGLCEAVKFSADIIRRSGRRYTLRHEAEEDLRGLKLYKISDSEKKERKAATAIPLYRRGVDITVRITRDSISASALGLEYSQEAVIEESKSGRNIEELIRKTFSESGESRYTLGTLTLINESGFTSPFLPPSLLKNIRRSFYERLDGIRTEPVPLPAVAEQNESFTLPPREKLVQDLPWSFSPIRFDGRTYLTFPPVTFNERRTFEEMEKAAEGEENVIIGLNNIGQLEFARRHPQYRYFADIYLYLSNRYAALALSEVIEAGYLWLERRIFSGKWPFKVQVTTFVPPAFISRTCYRHDAMGESCRGCQKKYDYTIRQQKERYVVKVRNCLTVVNRIS